MLKNVGRGVGECLIGGECGECGKVCWGVGGEGRGMRGLGEGKGRCGV